MQKKPIRNGKSVVEEKDKVAFVSYYNERSIIPVTQDIEDPEFVFKRNSLYSLLGFPLASLRGRDVLEFGPGGGFNATAVTHFSPRTYVFVDASDASLDELCRKASSGVFGSTSTEIRRSNIFDYSDDRFFDLVICEGVIPGQTKPAEMLSHVATFVRSQGFLSVTTASSVSLVSEYCRRIFRPFIFANYKSFEEQILASERIFGPHIKSLGAKTRPVRDWVLDVILHPWPKKFSFSIPDALNSLSGEFVFYNSSPKFLVDDRFYKHITRDAKNTSELALEQYEMISFAMLDYRIPLLEIDRGRKIAIDTLCDHLELLHDDITHTNSYRQLDTFLSCLTELANTLDPTCRQTVLSINDFVLSFSKMIQLNRECNFVEFSKWWGRGQQYVSFLRAPF
jgi:2-polyprenyl-3-methyl-5-hydroxy-6-metoxy-1,4-benzoquinol methylase